MSVETIRDIPVIVEHRRGCSRGDFEPMDFNEVQYTNSGFPFDNSGRRSRDPLEDIAQRHPEFAQHLQGFPRRSQRSGGDQDQDEFLRRRFERPFSSGRFERFGFPFERDDFEREPQRYYQAYPEYFENFQNQNPQSPPHNQPPSSPHHQQQQSSSSQTPQGYQQYPPQYSQQYQPQYSQQQSQENQQPSQQHPPQYQTQPSQSVTQGTQTEEGEAEDPQHQQQQQEVENESQEQKVESGQTRGRPIQQSNTCDLAQHQPPDEALNERGQRSMSAPPENKRFTSSVNIPMGGHQENNGAGGGAKSQAGSGSTERVIPIHVEGRDDPVLPKNFSGPAPTQTHHQQPQPERIFSDSPRSQPETIFGRRPEAFTQFVHRDPHRFPNDWPPHSFGGFPDDEFGFRQTESPSRFTGAKPQPQQQTHRQEASPPVHTQPPQPQEQKPNSQPAAASPPPPKQHQPLGPIEQIQAIQKDVSSLLRQVEAFGGRPKDKNYLYLDEMLTRNLLKLDNVDTQGQDAIRSARKEAIKCIERAIGLLEAKAAANVAHKQETMEVEQPQVPQDEEKMQTERASSQEPGAMETSPAESQNEPAEMAAASQEVGNKSEEIQQAKSAESVEGTEEQTKNAEEVKGEEPQKKEEQAAKSQSNDEAPKDSGEAKAEVKEGEKKQKKKIKKKVIKEDKDKEQ